MVGIHPDLLKGIEALESENSRLTEEVKKPKKPLKYCEWSGCMNNISGYGCTLASSGEDCYTIYGHCIHDEYNMKHKGFEMYEDYLKKFEEMNKND